MSTREAVISVIDRVPTNDAVAVDAAMETVKEKLLKSNPGPPISSLSWELMTDSNGFGAVRITFVMEDDPSGEIYSSEQLQPIHDLIWNEFNDREIERWPFIRFHLKSEMVEEEEDDILTDSEGPC